MKLFGPQWIFVCVYLFFTACQSVSTLPPELSLVSGPYSRVKYINPADLDDSFETVDTVEVVSRDAEAQIHNSLPLLFRVGIQKIQMKFGSTDGACVSHLKISMFTKQEMVAVPYQECRVVQKTRPDHFRSCTGFGSNFRCVTKPQSESYSDEECVTKTRQELKEIVYQMARAEIFRKRM